MYKLKSIKFIVLSIIFVLFMCVTSCYAVDLDLSDDDISSSPNNSYSSSNSSTSSSNSSNSTSSNPSQCGTTSTSSTPSATVTTSMPESGLGLSNILNIFLIVIGVLLILLSIAILIRLKK